MDTEATDLGGYSPPLSLWKLVEQHVARHEMEEIKSMLGISDVEETLELHEELDTLLEIWRDCRNNNFQTQPQINRLPEPPGMRERLIQEIQFFVENVKDKAQEQGRNETVMLDKYNSDIIQYAVSNSHSRSSSGEPPVKRCLSAIGRDGRETPMLRNGTPSSDRLSSSSFSTMSEDIEAMSDKLNILKLDDVMEHLKTFLAEEKECLIQDVRFLQQCIEEEANFTQLNDAVKAEPTIAELREERLKLEKDMLCDVVLQQKPLKTTGNFGAKSLTHLRPATGKSQYSVVPSNGPIKAVHKHAPDGVVLEGNVPESIIHKVQQQLNSDMSSKEPTANCYGAKLVKVGSIPAHQITTNRVPTPPPSGNRPSSALKFRTMIMSSRFTDDS